MPKVTVIIPVYNAEQHLRECLDSVLQQTLKDIEVLCINDGSKDNSLEILKEYEKKDNRFKIINKEHSNAGEARNKGLQFAKGDFLSFLDADDIFDKEMLEKAYNAAKKQKDIDVVVFAAKSFSTDRKKAKHIHGSLRKYNCPKNNPFMPIEMNNYLFNSFQNWAWNKIFRRVFIINNSIAFQSISHTNDMLFTCCALVKARKIAVVNEDLVYYRIGQENNLQSTNHDDPTSFWQAYTKTYKRIKEYLNEDFYHYRNSLANWILAGCRYNLRCLRADSELHDEIERMIANKVEQTFELRYIKNFNIVWVYNLIWYKILQKKYSLRKETYRSYK